jgi:hypothetical protein
MKKPKIRNPVAKDLRTPKYRMRVVLSVKRYDRSKEKSEARKEFNE